MPLLPHVKKYLETLPSVEYHTAIDVLKLRGSLLRILPPVEDRPAVQQIEDRTVPGPDGEVPIRIYTPIGEGPYPLFVFFHGGGFVLRSIEEYDQACRLIASQTGSKVISVEYRLAPEHPFPAATEDGYAVTLWVAEHVKELNGDPDHLIVGGDSAGGNLATVVAMMARDKGTPSISKQILIYPGTDYYKHGVPSAYPSYIENSVGYGLTSEVMSYFWELYLKGENPPCFPYAG